MKKITPLILSAISVLLILYFWNFIKLPYDENNLIIGNYYFNKINPSNDTIRFLFFLIIPFLVYLVSYLKFYKNNYSLKINSENYFLKYEDKKNKDNLKHYFLFFVVFILVEFITLDFRYLVRPIDFFHEGTYLVPAINYLENKNLFDSTLYDYGFVANNLAVISYYIFGSLSIGGLYLIKLFLILLVKLLLILISKNLILSLELENTYKKFFFIFFTFIVISLPDYYNPLIFYQRYFLYLLFIFFLGTCLTSKKNQLQLIFLGFFSLISILWWWDIGAYTNALIVVTLLYFLIHYQIKRFLFLLIGISVSWAVFILSLSTETLNNFFYQFNFIYTASDYLLGLEYPTPFNSDSARGTKTLIIFYLISIMLIHLNLSKTYKVSFQTKILLNTLFLAGIIGFKTALMRSDTPHIKSASGIIFFLILFLCILFIFQRLKISNYILSIYKKYNFNFIFFTILSFFYLSSIPETGNNIGYLKKIDNIKNLRQNISYLINADDNNYLNDNYIQIINRYKELSKEDECIQSFTDDISLPYFVKKPTCTKYFISGAQILNEKSETNFIEEFNNSLPNIILKDSPIKFLVNPLNTPKTQEFINQNYSFYERFNGFSFYKKN